MFKICHLRYTHRPSPSKFNSCLKADKLLMFQHPERNGFNQTIKNRKCQGAEKYLKLLLKP